MSPDLSSSTLRRMAGGPSGGPDSGMSGRAAPSAAPDLLAALGMAALRVGDDMSGLGLATGERTARRVTAEAAFDDLNERALCLPIDPPGMVPGAPTAHSPEVLAALTGLIVLHPALTDALVEVQTIGRVDGPARPARRATRIDAALVQPFARALLVQMQRLLPAATEEPRPGALRGGSFIAGPDSLALILTSPQFLRLDMAVKLGDGLRDGSISVILPVDAAPLPQAGEALDPEADWKAAMRAATEEAPVLLQAVLPPMRLPLSRLMDMKAGDLIPLDPQALSQIVLHGGASGLTLPGRKRLPRGAAMVARLGQLNGLRAVKIAALPGEAVDRGCDGQSEFGGTGQLTSSKAETASDGEDGPKAERSASQAASGSLAAMDQVPAMDGLSDMSELPDLPEWPDLPELPDLPDPPDLPDLP